MATFSGIHFADSGSVTDERLNGLRLSDHFRVVLATWSGALRPYPPQYVVQAHDSSRPDSFILLGELDRGLILPIRLAGSVTFSVLDVQFRVEDISTIGDTLHVTFGKPIEVSFLIDGEPGATKEYSLRGEPGSGADGYVTTLSNEALRSGQVQVRVPMPGRYRLHIAERPRPVGGRAVMQVTETEPLGEPFEVLPPGGKEGSTDRRVVPVVAEPPASPSELFRER
jgi:hypothetical protein